MSYRRFDDSPVPVIAKIQEEWPFYEDLHTLWCELPNYNPIGVTTSNPGQDFAGKAAALFTKKGGETEPSSGIEDEALSAYEGDEYEGDGDADVSESRPESEGDNLGTSDAENLDEQPDESEVKKVSVHNVGNMCSTHNCYQLNKKNRRILKAREDKKLALEKSQADEKAKAAKNSKKRNTLNEALEEIQLLEMKEAAARRAEKNRIREKELDLAAKKQEFEKEKYKAKVRKMEFDAKKNEQQFELIRMMLSRDGGSTSGQQAMVGTFDNLMPSTSTPSTGASQSSWDFDPNQFLEVPVGELSTDLQKWTENLNNNRDTSE